MSAVQDVRTEIATALGSIVQSYDYLPGSAQLPAAVVGLPERVNHAVTSGYWRIELPIFLVQRSADPAAAEDELLDLLVLVVALLKASSSTGSSWSSLKVVDTTDFYSIQVGSADAISCSVNVELMIPNPS